VTKIQSLLVHQGDKILPLPVVNIGILQLKNQVVQLHTMEGSQFPVFQSLEELENKLAPEFFRINRQFIVNRKAIKDVSRYFGRKLLINLTIPFSEQLSISKEKTSYFMEWLSEN
jgi:DNA-binding LytR/AlgR family response regulator